MISVIVEITESVLLEFKSQLCIAYGFSYKRRHQLFIYFIFFLQLTWTSMFFGLFNLFMLSKVCVVRGAWNLIFLSSKTTLLHIW